VITRCRDGAPWTLLRAVFWCAPNGGEGCTIHAVISCLHGANAANDALCSAHLDTFSSQSHKQYSSLLHLLAQGSIPNLSFRRFTLQRRYLTTKRAARLPKHLPSAPKQTPPVTRTIPLARAPTHRGGPRICRLIPHLHPPKMLSPSSSPTALSLHQQTHLCIQHTFQNDPHPTNTYPLSSSLTQHARSPPPQSLIDCSRRIETPPEPCA
jgi:hypothetical protein